MGDIQRPGTHRLLTAGPTLYVSIHPWQAEKYLLAGGKKKLCFALMGDIAIKIWGLSYLLLQTALN